MRALTSTEVREERRSVDNFLAFIRTHFTLRAKLREGGETGVKGRNIHV